MTEVMKPAWQDGFVQRYHDRMCRPSCPNDKCWQRWVSLIPVSALHAAADWLQEHPQDARTARLILHDAVCLSGCRDGQRDDHARRQTDVVVALRAAVRAVNAGGSR